MPWLEEKEEMIRELSPEFARQKCICRIFLTTLTTALFLLTASSLIPSAKAQFDKGPTNISGTVFDSNGSQPVARVRVDIRAANGAEIATTFTDSDGRFHAIGPNGAAQSYVVSVSEPGYEPIEERVEPGEVSGVIVTLRRSSPDKPPADSASGGRYTVNVSTLQAPVKARKAFEKGIERLQKQDPQGSLAYFKEATDAFPNYYEAFYELGMVNMELRRGDDAERALQKAVDLSGGQNPEPQFALGALLCDRGQYAESEKLLRRAMVTDSSSWKGHLFLGEALFGQNRLDEAEANANAAVTRKPDLASGYVLLANIHIREHKYIDAVKELDTYLKLKPDSAASNEVRDVRNAAQRVLLRFAEMAGSAQLFY